jgi:hypothetical protein
MFPQGRAAGSGDSGSGKQILSYEFFHGKSSEDFRCDPENRTKEKSKSPTLHK